MRAREKTRMEDRKGTVENVRGGKDREGRAWRKVERKRVKGKEGKGKAGRKNEAITYHIIRLSVCEMVTCWRVVCVSCSTYVVVAPQIVRAGSTYDVIVTIFDAESVVNVDVSLRNARDVIIASSRRTVTAGQRSLTTYHLTALTWNTWKTHGIFFCRAMLCIRGTSHGPVSVCLCLSVCHKPVFY